MKNLRTKPLSFEVNLTEIEGDGDFPCPKCGINMSPEDLSDDVYAIVNTKLRDDDELEELIILCNKCGSKIRLFGWLKA